MQEERGLNILQADYINMLLVMNIIVKWELSLSRYPSHLQNKADQIPDIEVNLQKRRERKRGNDRQSESKTEREKGGGDGGRTETVNPPVTVKK